MFHLQAALEKAKDAATADKASLEAKVKELEAKIKSMDKTNKTQQSNNSDSEVDIVFILLPCVMFLCCIPDCL